MKNADLVVLGAPVASLDISAFTAPSQMTDWEFAAYDAYGHERCDAENIFNLSDLFGEDFDVRFTRAKKILRISKDILERKLEVSRQEKIIAALMDELEGLKGT